MLLLFIFALLGTCYANPVTTSCSEDEILKPITDFNRMVEELHSPLVNLEKKLDEISNFVDDIEEHYDTVKKTCGDEKINGLKNLKSFVMDTHVIKLLEMSFLVLADDMDSIKNKFENFGSKQIRQYMIAQFYTVAENFKVIIKATKLMKNDTNIINEMHEGIIYTLNDTNAHLAKDLVPVMKEFITENNEEETLAYAKNNLKMFVERSLHNYSDALVLLNEIDSEMADQTVQELVQSTFTNSVFSKAFSIVNNLPTVHLKALALKSLYEKIILKDLQNSLVSAKVYVFSKDIIQDRNITDTEAIKILNDIVEIANTFSKNLVHGHFCGFNKDEGKEHHGEYIANIIIEHPDEIGSVHKVEENGALIKMDLEAKNNADDMKYLLSLENDDYSTMDLPVISKQRYTYVSLTDEEFCGLNPQPEYNICVPALKFLYYTHEEAESVKKQSYEILKNFKSPCNSV